MTRITAVAGVMAHALLFAVGVLVLVACGGGSEQAADVPSAPTSPGLPSTRPTELPLPGSMPALDGKAFQEELLQDGVTEAEYERAVMTTLQCLVERGGSYFDLQWSERNGARTLQYGAGELPGFVPGEGQPSIHDECWAEWSRAVEGQWAIQNEPTEEELQVMREKWLECVHAEGFDDIVSYDEGITLSARHGDEGLQAFFKCNLESGIGGGGDIQASGTAP